MRAKPDLVPDCDVHGEPMYLDERPASELGLAGSRDVIVWRCSRAGCRRFFEGGTGYRDAIPGGDLDLTARCPNDGAFLVAQQALGSYTCPVAGCSTVQAWDAETSHEVELASAS